MLEHLQLCQMTQRDPGSSADSTFSRLLSAVPAKALAQLYWNTTSASTPFPELLTHPVARGLAQALGRGKELAKTGKVINIYSLYSVVWLNGSLASPGLSF